MFVSSIKNGLQLQLARYALAMRGCLVSGRRWPGDHNSRMLQHLSFSSFPASQGSIEQAVEEANARCSGILEIRKTKEKGWGLFAIRTIQPGEAVMSATATSSSTEPDSHSVQTGWKNHVQVDLPTRFINHCCSANVGLQNNDKGAYDFIALHEIQAGTELVWDYETSEYEITYDGPCLCGSPECRGKLRGYKYHGSRVKAKYGPKHIADYLKEATNDSIL